MKIALVVMPWVEFRTSPLGVAALKGFLEKRGVEVDCHFLNIRMADRLGLSEATVLSDLPGLWSEWFFAYHLFGPGGTGQLREELEDLRKLPAFDKFIRLSQWPVERWRRLLHEDIPSFINECLEIPWSQYGLVGFSNMLHSQAACLTLARRIKERLPAMPLVMGGANVEGAMGRALLKACDWIDYVVDGEGELPLLGLVESLQRKRPADEPIAGLVRRNAAPSSREPQPIAMDELPLPDHADFVRAFKSAKSLGGTAPVISFEASRGCWWGQKQHCTFCGIENQSLVYRAKSPERVVSQILELHEKHATNFIVCTDLILSLEHMRRVLPELARIRKERRMDLELYVSVKSNLTKEQIQSMAGAGVTGAGTGIESFSTPVLKAMRKGVRGIANIQTLKFMLENGIKPTWPLLFGFPGERAEDYARMIEEIPSLVHLPPPTGAGPVSVYRFSPLQADPAAFGLGRPRADPVYRHLYPEDFDLDELAYYFERPGEMPGWQDYMGELTAAVKWWHTVWRKSFFACRRGPGAVELYDCRPKQVHGGLEYRHCKLTGLEAEIFRACESASTVAGIARACRGAKGGEAEVRAALAGMVAQRWVYREDDSFLALAVPLQSLPAPQYLSLAMMIEAEEQRLRSWAKGRVPEKRYDRNVDLNA